MQDNKPSIAEYSAIIDKTMDNAGNYARLSVLLDFLKSSCEIFCTKKSKNEDISQEDAKFFKNKLKQLGDLSSQIIDR